MIRFIGSLVKFSPLTIFSLDSPQALELQQNMCQANVSVSPCNFLFFNRHGGLSFCLCKIWYLFCNNFCQFACSSE